MRNILFKGKRVNNGKWVYGIPVETEAENGVKEFIISRAKWESDDNSIDFLETDDHYLFFEDNIFSYECEVIGNIHDNPELLEKINE